MNAVRRLIRELRNYGVHRGWAIAAEPVDTGWSGASARRRQLDSPDEG